MNTFIFDGQQQDERILHIIRPHKLSKYIAIIRLVCLSGFFYLFLTLISGVVPNFTFFIRYAGILLGFAFLVFGIWWNNKVYSKSVTYITDRRIIRFDVVSPFFTTKRALFWNEALKAKAYSPNIFYRTLKIGVVEVNPQLSDKENVLVRNVYFFDDVANYVDKILFTFKNKPEEIVNLKPFISKPRGERD